jgi:hypothetical protein
MPMEPSSLKIGSPDRVQPVPPDTENITIEDALTGAFNLDTLTMMLRRQLGIVLEDEMDVHRGKRFIVGDLVQLAIREGWRDDLVRGALADNTKNPNLKKAARAIGIAPPQQPTAAPTGSIPAGDLNHLTLQKLARERGVMVKFEDYTAKLAALARAMCRIEIPSGTAFGTGWLVGPDLLLTNYHVIEEVKKNAVTSADVTCRFDYFKAGSEGTVCGLANAWEVDSRPYALADQRADAPDPTAEELDYALIRLARPVGNEGAEGNAGNENAGAVKRGWVPVRATPPAVIAEDIVMVPQFPDDRSLELSFGKALAYNKSGTRLRYDANTEEGASGSPAVTMALEPFGLHHAGGPGRSQRYNQCVPLRLIVERMSKRNVTPFWEPDSGGGQ